MTASARAGRYELIEEIGRGAMGVVYRATDPVIGRPVAVKTMRLANPGNGLSHEDLLSRFQTEARAAGRLTHPNIVVVYDAGEEDSVLYITMELVEGPSLQTLIEAHHPFPLPRILRLMEQACGALDYAHQHNVIHRDIKPANMMLTGDDALKITDFGTAKILQYGTMQTAQTIGTPSYMSPEQIKGRPVDGRSDLFSLGVVLYELVTGQKPFPGDSVTTVIYKIVNEEPVPPRDLDSAIHPGLSAVITKALAKPAEQRFQSCRQFMEALQHYAKYQEPVAEATVVLPRGALPSVPAVESGRMVAVRGDVPGRSPSSGRTQHPTGRTQQPQAGGSARKTRSAAWLVLILLAVIAVAGYQVLPALQEVWQRSQPDRAAAENALRSASSEQKTATSEAPAAAAASDAPGSSEQPSAATSDDVNSHPPVISAPPAPAPLRNQNEDAAVAPNKATGNVPKIEEAVQPAVTNRSVSQPSAAVTPATETAPPASREVPLPVNEALPPVQPSKEHAATTKDATAAAISPAAPPYKPSRLPATPAAAAWQTRIWRILVQSGIDGQVEAVASGNTITLTGKLRPMAHERLLARLDDVPDRIQVIDDIDSASPQTANSSDATPNSAAPSLNRR